MNAPSSDEVRLGDHVVVRRRAPPQGDVIFLPTNESGTQGELNTQILASLKLDLHVLPDSKQLSPGYYIQAHTSFTLCFVVTVGRGHTAGNIWRNLANALRDPRIVGARSVWIPLMGTGVGGLPLAESFKITTDVLQRADWPWNRADTIISVPDAFLDGAEELTDVVEEFRHASVSDDKVPQWPVPISTAMKSLISFALALGRPGSSLTTELLMFALADYDAEGLSGVLFADRSALFFSVAIKDLAGPSYQSTWSHFFGTAWFLPPPPFPTGVPTVTHNVQKVMFAAQTIARSKGRTVINIDDFIRALLNSDQGKWLDHLKSMGVSQKDLLTEYEDMKAGQIAMTLHNDVAASQDNLGFGSYADAIAKFLLNTKTPPPLSVSIQAPWGAGKSSLMHMIRDKIDPKDLRAQQIRIGTVPNAEKLKLGAVLSFLNGGWGRKGADPEDGLEPSIPASGNPRETLITVWFNAWMYQTSEQVWAGLVDAIVSQLADRLSFKQREMFLLWLQLARIDDTIIRRKILDRLITVWWARVERWALLAGSALAAMIGIGVAHEAAPKALAGALAWPGTAGLAVALVLQLASVTKVVRVFFDTKKEMAEEPAKFSLAEYIKVPDYDKSVGQIHQIHADLRRVLSVTPKDGASGQHRPIVVFIDDLDRCSPNKVASVVEGVNMLLAMEEYRFIFIIGMDPQIVAAALENAHDEMLKQLPSFERAVPLGWRFMDKFVQLPFTIPPNRQENVEKLLLSLGAAPPRQNAGAAEVLGATGARAAPHDRTLSDTADEDVDPAGGSGGAGTSQAAIASESRDVGRIIRLSASYVAGNPREMKRMVNLARLYLALRNERRKQEPRWHAPDLDHYARWIALTLRWPDMMRWLQWGADEASWQPADIAQSLIVRRLTKLENAAMAPSGTVERDVKAWAAEIKTHLYVEQEATVQWMLDPKLFEFFHDLATLPVNARLSRAAQSGFW